MKFVKLLVGIGLVIGMGMAVPSASASLYIERGIECLEKRPTVSVGELVEIGTNFGQQFRRGVHIQFYSEVLNSLKRAKLHRAGDSYPVKADKLGETAYVAEVANDFGDKFKYALRAKAGELDFVVTDVASGEIAYETTFKNCREIR